MLTSCTASLCTAPASESCVDPGDTSAANFTFTAWVDDVQDPEVRYRMHTLPEFAHSPVAAFLLGAHAMAKSDPGPATERRLRRLDHAWEHWASEIWRDSKVD